MTSFRSLSVLAIVTIFAFSGEVMAAPKSKKPAAKPAAPAAQPATSAPAHHSSEPSYSSSSSSPGTGAIHTGATSINVPLGLLIYTASGSSARFGFGVDATHYLNEEWGVGGYFKLGVGTGTALYIGGQAEYRLPSCKNLSVGGRIGYLNISVDTGIPGVSASAGSLTIGPKANYDYFLAPNMSIGGETEFYFISNGSSFGLSFLGAFKYWL